MPAWRQPASHPLLLAAWLCAAGCSSEGPAAPRESLVPAPALEAAPAKVAIKPGAPQAAAPTPVPPSKSPATTAGSSEGPVETVPVAPRFAGTELTQDFIVEGLKHLDTLSFKPIGARAALFRTRLSGPFEAAFKAPSAARPLGPQAEVGAYAISRCLGLTNVPPAVLRGVPLETLHSRLDPKASAAWPTIEARVLTAPDKLVLGALIFWIPDLSTIGVDKQSGLDRAREWLRIGGPIAEADYTIAAGISTLLSFDYVIGNFDRWSGGNVKGSTDRARVYVRDHDLALPGRLSDSVHARLASEMQIAQRISRAFYEHARELSAQCIERELVRCGVEDGQLGAKPLAGVLDRRDGFVSHVRALIEEHGESSVLVFP